MTEAGSNQEKPDMQPKSLTKQFDKATIAELPGKEVDYVFDWHLNGRCPPTQWFQDTPQTYIDRATAFTPDQIYPKEDDKDTIHDHIRTARSMMVESEDPKFEPESDDFLVMFLRAISPKDKVSRSKEGKNLITLGLRLTKSSPEIFEDIYDTKQGKLQDRRDTRAWMAANQTFGSHWTFTKKPDAKPIRKPPPTPASQKKSNLQQSAIRFSTTKKDDKKQDGWQVVQTKRGLFRKKANLESNTKKKSSSEHARKQKTYLKARRPPSKDTTSADADAVTAFNNILSCLLKFDQRVVILPWPKPWENAKSAATVLTKSSDKIEAKSVVESYVDRLFLSAGKSPFIRFQIGHDQDIKNLEDWDHPTLTELRAKGIQVSVEHIQDADIAIAGWFMGSNPKSFNCNSFLPVLQAHSLLSNLQIDLQTRSVKPDVKHKWKRTDPRAVHIFCARRNLNAVKKAMNGIYGSKSKLEHMPMGRSLRFIPYTADPKGRAPLRDMKRNIQAAIRKQQRFIESTEVVALHGIVDLDYAQKVIGYEELSIREILQSMKASDYQTSLFLAVDEKWNGEVALTFHTSLEDQVQMITSYLPLLLAERFGPRAWGWFSQDTQAELSGFYWDPEKQRIASTDKDAIADNIADFDDYDDISDGSLDESDAEAMEINIELQIDLDDPPDDARIVGDENRSVVTFAGILGSPDPPASPSAADTKNSDAHMSDNDADRPEDVSTITNDDQSPAPTPATTNSPSAENQEKPPSTNNGSSGQQD